ncbi:hypothetical protein SD80_005435 [Scytonema tolypothrichoides VB-61278]|nr:hypothetical protein SD80_005435 [Scytonema tolypothrichoides VB-61278]
MPCLRERIPYSPAVSRNFALISIVVSFNFARFVALESKSLRKKDIAKCLKALGSKKRKF